MRKTAGLVEKPGGACEDTAGVRLQLISQKYAGGLAVLKSKSTICDQNMK